MKVDGQWKIVDVTEAQVMLEEFKEKNKNKNALTVGSSSILSLNPTDPRLPPPAELGSHEPDVDPDDPPF